MQNKTKMFILKYALKAAKHLFYYVVKSHQWFDLLWDFSSKEFYVYLSSAAW